ncbi:MAG: hypothetical protein A2W80_05260 [Candidatus Riflebacteria bacterium GWC2_50_8]|nr:MAG: hypothetical protein A2W80_05260 [Candidatus Riflebacteria bacterium GWC2_50_8]
MKTQSSGLFLIILLLTMVVATMSARAAGNQFSYQLPANLSLLISDSHFDSNGKLQLSVILQSTLGNLSDLEIYFDSSKDLKVLTNLRTLKNLKPGSVRKIRILASKTGQQPDEIGSWVKVGVKYLPDYDAIVAMASDAEKYPDQFERQKLLELAQSNAQKEARYSDAIRFFADQAGSKK